MRRHGPLLLIILALLIWAMSARAQISQPGCNALTNPCISVSFITSGVSGGNKGAGTINAHQFYIDGALITIGPFLPLAGGTMTGALAQTGTTNPLTITGNAAAPASYFSGTLAQITGVNAGNAGLTIDAAAGVPVFAGRRADGTIASPTQVVSGNVLGRFGGLGYAAAGDSLPAEYVSVLTGRMDAQATESWIGLHNGSQLSWWTTPNGTAVPAQAATLTQAGSLVIGGAGGVPSSAFSLDDQTGRGINTTGGLAVTGGATIGATLGVTSGATIGGTLGVTGLTTVTAINATAASPIRITGIQALNLLANQASPILSPELQNVPNPLAVYLNAPLVLGYNTALTTSSVNTYDSMLTSVATVTGTVTTHYGFEERTIYLKGTGNLNAELNVTKNYFNSDAGTTLLLGEDYEAGADIAGTVVVFSGYSSGLNVTATGRVTQSISAFTAGFNNNNTTAGAVNGYIGFRCTVVTGSGSTVPASCLQNEAGDQPLRNAGHYTSTTANVPTLGPVGCGTGAALSATSNDQGGQLTIGSGGTITVCAIFLHVNFGVLTTGIIVASDGGTPPVFTYNGGGFSVSSLRANGRYEYLVWGG
jgi:hypothetical protein